MRSTVEFRKLLLASLISQIGSHLLTIAISASIYARTNSPILATWVFVLSYLPSALFSEKVGSWIDRNSFPGVLIKSDITALVLTLLAAICIQTEAGLLWMVPVLGLRSICLIASRSSAIRWIREVSLPSKQDLRLKLFFLTFFCSTALAGVAAGLILSRFSLVTASVIDAATYLIAIAIQSSLQKVEFTSTPKTDTSLPAGPKLIREILSLPVTRSPFLGVVLSQSFFQGAFTVLVTFLPIQIFKMGAAGVSPFQMAASLGIIGGFAILWRYPSLMSGSFSRTALFVMFGIICWLTSLSTRSLSMALATFMIMNLVYELIWLHNSSEYFKAIPTERTAAFQFSLTATASLGMSIAALTYATLFQHFKPFDATLGVIAAGALIVFSIERYAKISKSPAVIPVKAAS